MRESSIIVQWGVLELRSVRFIPLLIGSGNSSKTQAGVKYFLRQAPVSLWLLRGVIVFNSSLFYGFFNPALLFKLALPPFHGWLFSLIRSISIKELAILLTVQKFLPFHILEIVLVINILIISLIRTFFLLIISVLSVRGFKPVLLVSSISGSYWPVRVTHQRGVWLEFLIIYSFFLLLLCFFLTKKGLICYARALKKRLTVRILLALQLFNLGGVPPLAGFFIKLILIKAICLQIFTLVIGLLLVSFIILYFYLQLITPLLIFNSCINNQVNDSLVLNNAIFLRVRPIIPFVFCL
jgi:NADH:ubiquinone oxidoreductase subunit 2 (subunit N)